MYWLFLLWPLAEIYVFVLVGKALGWGNAVLLTVATSALGLLVMRLGRHRQIFGTGELTARSFENYLFGNLGALALVLPGFLSDALGLALIFPWTRRLLAAILRLARFDVRGRNLGPFSILKVYGLDSEARNSRDDEETLDAEFFDEEYYDANRDAESSDDDVIDVEYTVRD